MSNNDTTAAGWKLVPVEPTEAMNRAAVIYANGNAVYKNVAAEALKIEESIYGEVWSAMLAAAPQPPAAQYGEAVAYYVQRVAPGKRDDGARIGLWWRREDAEEFCDDRHVLRKLVDAQPAAAPQPVAPDGLLSQFLAAAKAAGITSIREVPGLIDALTAAEPQQVAQGEELTTLMAALKGYFAAADAAWLETVAEAIKLGLRSLPIGADGAKALEKFDELRKCFNALAAAPPARQALTDEQRAAYERVREEFELVSQAGRRACIASAMLNVDALLHAHDIGGKGGANG